MPDSIDNNPQPDPTLGPKVPPKIADQLAKGQELFDAVKSGKGPTEGTVASAESKPEDSNPKEGENVNVPVQFQTKEGDLDAEKLAKSTQHQAELNRQKQEAIEKYKELQRKHSKLVQEEKALKTGLSDTPPQGQAAPAPGIETQQASGDGQTREKILQALKAGLEQGQTEETILKAMELVASNATERAMSKVHKFERDQQEREMLSNLDRAANQDNWILTPEGQQEMARVFQEKPFLWQSNQPYLDALRFINKPAQVQPPAAQLTPAAKQPLPMLSGGGAVPPPPSAPVSDEQRLEQLSRDLGFYSKRRNQVKVAEIQEKMDELFLKKRANLGA